MSLSAGTALDQEYEEKQARLAEIELNSASNKLRHHDEIMARPAKTWFQTKQEKQAAKEAGARLHDPDARALVGSFREC